MFNSKRRRIRELELEVAAEKASTWMMDKVVEMLIGQNKQLHDRLLARSLPELKTYTSLDDGVPSAQVRATRPEEDDLNAGEVLDVE